ncbi:Tol-Pal system beta propeller repeat protein TolB [Chlorobium sp. N1]|uniref:Tol-Pal system beta propeller repeat protein TolB n=1 Tax=Chlorobium sp. N1 TaxID=2491138 RepID=UPI00103D97E5|nr:Tol-Pal system beta propeller repeat protein TolB [Chlorobium sp. N1]TCD47046.1 Tol-Pal system beta propeller repeat protein TolB [Chlorobium sp. N1]
MRLLMRPAAAFLLTFLLSLAFSLPARATDGEYIAIRKEGSGRIALIVAPPLAEGGKASSWSGEIDREIRRALDFTGLFNMIPPPMNLFEEGKGGKPALNFGALNSIGAEVFAGGTVSGDPDRVRLTMAAYETFGAKPILSKTYTGSSGDLRALAHAFCADLVQLLTGHRSVFGSSIVFVSNQSGFKEIYSCAFDGSNVRQLTRSRSISLTPALSPDGTSLAFTDYTSGRPALKIMNLSDRRIASVRQSGVSIDPGWRSNAEVATTLSFQGDQEIYLVRTDGSLSRRVTSSRGIDLSPSFSPDGSRMAFVSARYGNPQIFILDLISGQTRRLTYNGNYNTQPSWSPAGDKIAYSSMEKNGEINIFTIRADGSGATQLTSGDRENESPSWSPGGDMIVFTSSRQGQKKLYVMNANGEHQRRLLQMSGEQMQPSWSFVR